MEVETHKAIKGFAWSAFQKIASMIISFTANLILARLLTPDDFGLLGIMLAFINISAVFVDAGFGSALIQKKHISQTDLSTIFYWNLFVSLLLYVALFFLSPLIGKWFQSNMLSEVIKLLALVLILNSLSLVQTTVLKKRLEFKLIAISFVIASFMAFIISVTLALKDYGIWSLVAFQLSQSAINAMILWIFAKWYPSLLWSWSAFKQLFGYGVFLLLSSLAGTASKQIQTLLIGKICSPVTLGYYSQAKNMENAPTNTIYTVVGQVVFPLFSLHHNSMEEFVGIYKKVINTVAYVTIPIMFILIIIAKPLILLLLTDKWLQSIPYFQLLCLCGVSASIVDINIFAISALGKSKTIFKLSLLNSIVALCMMSVGAIWSIYGILISLVVYSFYSLGLYSFYIRRYLKIRITGQLGGIMNILMISVFLSCVIYCVPNAIVSNQIFAIVISILIFLGSYLAITAFFKVEASLELISFCKKYLTQKVKL